MEWEGKREILTTKDYSIFRKLTGNRSVTNSRVQKIIESIKSVGYITNPIIVNEKMEVIDGQGRKQALQELERPIDYIIVPGLTIEHCIAMNIDMTNWGLIDYIKSFSDQGKEGYIKFFQAMTKYPKLSITVVFLCFFRYSCR